MKNDDLFWANDTNNHLKQPTIEDYKEAIQILMVDYADVWEKTNTFNEVSKSKKTINTSITFVDIAGLVKGASKGEGLGNKFLSHIREVALSLIHL